MRSNLFHDFRSDTYLMSYGENRTEISSCAAKALAINPFFTNAVTDNTDNTPATITLSSPLSYAQYTEMIPLNVKVSDPDTIHHVQFALNALNGNPAGIQSCIFYENTTETTAEFILPDGASDARTNKVTIRVFDKTGAVTSAEWILRAGESTPQPQLCVSFTPERCPTYSQQPRIDTH